MSTQPTAPVAMTPRVWRFTLLTLAIAVMGACTSSGDTESPAGPPVGDSSSAAAEPAPVPEEIADPEEAAVAAYLRYRQAFAEAAAIPDPAYSGLVAAAADQALESTQSALQRLIEDGLRNEGAPISAVKVKESALNAAPVQVVVTDCSDSTPWPLVIADTGEPAPGEEYGRRSIDAMVELRDGTWLVTEIVVRSIGSCLRQPHAARPSSPAHSW